MEHYKQISLMEDLMYKETNYNWTFCYSRSSSRTEDTFRDSFPVAYEKIMNGETNISRKDMGLN